MMVAGNQTKTKSWKMLQASTELRPATECVNSNLVCYYEWRVLNYIVIKTIVSTSVDLGSFNTNH